MKIGFLDRLDNLRKRPEKHRKRVAVISATLITALIAVVWISTLPAMFSQLTAKFDQIAVENTQTPPGGIASPINSMKASVADAFDSLKGLFSGSISALKTSTESLQVASSTSSSTISIMTDQGVTISDDATSTLP